MKPLDLGRHALSIAILPGTVTCVVPISVARRYGVAVTWPAGPGAIVMVLFGCLLLGVGLALFLSSLRRFATEGRGTLAPWDPPRRLVLRGPYRYVRNPMISGVIFLLAGEAAVLRSVPHAMWAAMVLGINAIYIPLLEEAWLAERFGAEYLDYCRHVHRFVPRLRPWSPSERDQSFN